MNLCAFYFYRINGKLTVFASRVDEDPFEKQMNETSVEQLRASTGPRYVKPQTLDQLEEWIKEKPIPCIANEQTYPDVVRMWRQLNGCPASGGGKERVIFSAGKQRDALKKNTMDKTQESTLKTSINTMLPTCDDKGVSVTDDDTYRKRK